MAYSQTNKDMAGNAYSSSYTCDGYYINGPDSKGKEREEELPPQPRPFTPQPAQPSLVGNVTQIGARPVAVGMNKNNSSDAYSKQGNINQNMHNEAMYTNGGNQPGYPPSSVQDFMEQTRPSREAMADMDFAGFPFGADAHLMLNEDVLDPLLLFRPPSHRPFLIVEVMNGPRRLRALVSELKETCAIEGDMEVCHLVQQIWDVIEVLPQLKPTFNLEAEIGLALQPLRSECSQLRRRLRILNQQLKERERQAKEGLDPKVQVELLTLQTENMELQKKLTEAEQSCHKLNLFISGQQQQMQSLQYQLQQKEHEKLVARQENVQQLNRLNQEVEKMSLRNQSLQSKLAAADCQNSVLDLNLKQSNMEVAQLQDTLGRMKQAVLEVMQHVDNNAEGNSSHSSAKVRNLPSFRVLSGLLKSGSTTPRTTSSENTSLSSRGPLDVSGNQRISKYPKPDKNENAQRLYSHEALHKVSPRDTQLSKEMHKTKELFTSKEPCHKSALQSRETSLSSGKSDGGDAFLSKDSLSTGPIAPSPLTVEAVAAHNEHHGSLSERDFSFHSWEGPKPHRASQANQSLPYHSDPESSAVLPIQARKSLHNHHRIRQWSTGLEDERWQGGESSRHSSFHGDFEHTAAKSKASSGKADSLSETGTVPTLSEFPLSEAESMKHSARDTTRHSQTDYDKNYSDTNRSTISLKPPAPTPSKPIFSDHNEETATTRPQDIAVDKRNPSVSSPNSSLGHSTSNTSQKDFFQGTELDMSLSTIPEDGLSSVTSLTGASVCTAMSLDDRKFREGVSALDEKISKCKESLQIWKKTFS